MATVQEPPVPVPEPPVPVREILEPELNLEPEPNRHSMVRRRFDEPPVPVPTPVQ